ncbi:MAG: hypothetical protein ICV59_02405 [Thermoleophilia bacterium]|nr:hypothetical protein [Thermoleophilia bacterium]
MRRHALCYASALIAFAALPSAGLADEGGAKPPEGKSATAAADPTNAGEPARPPHRAQPAQAGKRKPKTKTAKVAAHRPPKPKPRQTTKRKPVATTTQAPADKVTICHRTGSDSNPYVEITISRNALDAHLKHGDLMQTPCPAGSKQGAAKTKEKSKTSKTNAAKAHDAKTKAAKDKVTICHRTASDSNPYVEITVSASAWPAHQAHGDVNPVPAGGCPAGTTTTTTAATTTAATASTGSDARADGEPASDRALGSARSAVNRVRRGQVPFTDVPLWLVALGAAAPIGLRLARRSGAVPSERL